MDIYYVEINGIKIRNFKTFELAFEFVQKHEKTDDKDVIKIYHEEYIDEFHGSETSCRVYLLYISEKIN
jgi:hypothetical protein